MLFYFELTAELKFNCSVSNINFLSKQVTNPNQISCKWTDMNTQIKIYNCVQQQRSGCKTMIKNVILLHHQSSFMHNNK